MKEEVVFYFDVLGFSAKAAGNAVAAVDALSALAQILGTPQLDALTGHWKRRYSLSDSVFLTIDDPLDAVKRAAALVFSLVHFTASYDDPVLVRGAIASGPVQHLKGIFLTSTEPANLVGQGVVEAVRLEHAGLKGPRVLVSESLVETLKERDPQFVKWQLRPTAVPNLWEILWLLPQQPAALKNEELSIMDLTRLAVRLFKTHGGHGTYGDQYREFLLLAARSVERASRYVKTAEAGLTIPVQSLLPIAEMSDVCESISGLPSEFILELQTTLAAIKE